MVLIKEKSEKQYHRDNYEKHQDEFKKKAKLRYKLQKKNKFTVIKVNNLVIHAKNVTIVDE